MSIATCTNVPNVIPVEEPKPRYLYVVVESCLMADGTISRQESLFATWVELRAYIGWHPLRSYEVRRVLADDGLLAILPSDYGSLDAFNAAGGEASYEVLGESGQRNLVERRTAQMLGNDGLTIADRQRLRDEDQTTQAYYRIGG